MHKNTEKKEKPFECETAKKKRHFEKRWSGVNLLQSLTLALTSIRMGKIFLLRFVYFFFNSVRSVVLLVLLLAERRNAVELFDRHRILCTHIHLTYMWLDLVSVVQPTKVTMACSDSSKCVVNITRSSNSL